MVLVLGISKVILLATFANLAIMSFVKTLCRIGILPRKRGFWETVEYEN